MGDVVQFPKREKVRCICGWALPKNADFEIEFPGRSAIPDHVMHIQLECPDCGIVHVAELEAVKNERAP